MQESAKGFQEILSTKEGISGVRRRDSDPRRTLPVPAQGEEAREGDEPQSASFAGSTGLHRTSQDC